MNPLTQRYAREFLPAMLGYAVALPISLVLLLGVAMPPVAKVAVALLPVLPMGLAMWAVLRHVNRVDELQQRILVQATATSSLLIGMGTFALGFLQNARLLPSPSWAMLLVFPLMIMVWGVAVAFLSNRYRDG